VPGGQRHRQDGEHADQDQAKGGQLAQVVGEGPGRLGLGPLAERRGSHLEPLDQQQVNGHGQGEQGRQNADVDHIQTGQQGDATEGGANQKPNLPSSLPTSIEGVRDARCASAQGVVVSPIRGGLLW
jgi:hypothetical protein